MPVLEMNFNAPTTMKGEDFYAEYLGRKSEAPYEYRISNQFPAHCPLYELPETAACKSFGIGDETRVGIDSQLRGDPTNLNRLNRADTSTVLYGTAPYKAGYDVKDDRLVVAESNVKLWTTTFGPQRVITEQPYSRWSYLDAPTVVEPFNKAGKPTRFDTNEVVSAHHRARAH